MRHIAVTIRPDRIEKLRRLIPDVETFQGTTGCTNLDFRQICIPDTYRRLAQLAVAEGWDRGIVVMQDDVWIPHGPGFETWQAEYKTPLLIFGQTEKTGVAPKAFSASPEIWARLAEVWDGEGRIIPAWMPIVEEYGTVLDVTRGLGG